MKSRSAKAKGRTLQNLIAKWIRYLWPVLDGSDVKPAIMGESGIDINLSNHARQFFNYSVECKNVEKVNLWESYNQAVLNATKYNNCPLLIIKKNHKEPIAVLDAAEFFSIIAELYKYKNPEIMALVPADYAKYILEELKKL